MTRVLLGFVVLWSTGCRCGLDSSPLDSLDRCDGAGACRDGWVCVSGYCVDPETDAEVSPALDAATDAMVARDGAAELDASLDAGCAGGLAACGGRCVDLRSDPGNCGDCDAVCGEGEPFCLGSHCVCPPAEEGFEDCNGTCARTDTDPEHCGNCGDAQCKPGDSCMLGSCRSNCRTLQECDRSCVDLDSDPFHCGDCGVICADAEVCDGGTCKAACTDGRDQCGRACVDRQTSLFHCGSCGSRCSPDEDCDTGSCQERG